MTPAPGHPQNPRSGVPGSSPYPSTHLLRAPSGQSRKVLTTSAKGPPLTLLEITDPSFVVHPKCKTIPGWIHSGQVGSQDNVTSELEPA